MNAADGNHEFAEVTAETGEVAASSAPPHSSRAASPLLMAWSHCLPSPPQPSPQLDPAWQQYLLAGIAAR